MALTVLAMYDISDDDTRAKVAAVLQRWGDRVQLSVFVCTIPAEELDGMVEKVRSLIDPDHDSFYVVRQCGLCWADKVVLGQAHPPAPELFWAVL